MTTRTEKLAKATDRAKEAAKALKALERAMAKAEDELMAARGALEDTIDAVTHDDDDNELDLQGEELEALRKAVRVLR
jgi:hypothetical protein